MKVLHIQDIDYRSTCPTLVGCLGELKAWSDADPGHLPVIINIELKDDPLPAPFDGTPLQAVRRHPAGRGRRGDHLSVLGDRLITPDDVRGSAPDLAHRGHHHRLADRRGQPGQVPVLHRQRRHGPYRLPGRPPVAGRSGHVHQLRVGEPDAAVLKVNAPGDGSAIAALVQQGFLVRTRADADVVSPGADRDAALASGGQVVHSDFPNGESQFGTGYTVAFPTRVQARCNPVNTTPATCTAAAAVEPAP